MKVGVVTLHGYFNFGNRLQNYAMVKVLEKIDVKAETVVFKAIMSRWSSWDLKSVEYDKLDNSLKKLYKFKLFSDTYLNETLVFEEEQLNKFDCLIAGSDQVWNPYFCRCKELNFMTLVSSEKRLTYAPSFGLSKMPVKYEKEYIDLLNGIEQISVREEAGARIIKDLTGKDAKVLVDPTMLLTKEEWLSIVKRDEHRPKGKYLTTYFLGTISEEIKARTEYIANKYNLKIVELGREEKEDYFLADPGEFLDYIYNAEVILTDSFHGCVFSVLFEKALIIFNRNGQTKDNDMGSRIETFINKFELKNRQNEFVEEDEIFDINYEKAYIILEKERKKSFGYLDNILYKKIEGEK